MNLVGGGQRSIENLKVGDRVWSISHDGTYLFEDEVIFMMDNNPGKASNYNFIAFAYIQSKYFFPVFQLSLYVPYK